MQEKEEVYALINKTWQILKTFGFEKLDDSKWNQLVDYKESELNDLIRYSQCHEDATGTLSYYLWVAIQKYYEAKEKSK